MNASAALRPAASTSTATSSEPSAINAIWSPSTTPKIRASTPSGALRWMPTDVVTRSRLSAVPNRRNITSAGTITSMPANPKYGAAASSALTNRYGSRRERPMRPADAIDPITAPMPSAAPSRPAAPPPRSESLVGEQHHQHVVDAARQRAERDEHDEHPQRRELRHRPQAAEDLGDDTARVDARASFTSVITQPQTGESKALAGPLSFAISIVGVLVFVGLTAWDTQKIKESYDARLRRRRPWPRAPSWARCRSTSTSSTCS